MVAAAAGARVLRGGELPAGWTGKNHACHRLAQAAAEDSPARWWVFLDADVYPEPGFLGGLVQHLERHRPPVLTGFPKGLPGRGIEPLFLAWVGWILLATNPFALVSRLPFFSGNRYPSRYSVMLLLALAVLAGAGLAWLFNQSWLRDRRRAANAAGALLAGLLILLAIPVQALPMAHWLFAERWLYLPSVLMAVLVAAVLARVPVAGWALGLTAAVVLLPASWQYSSKLANNRIMNEEVVRRQPDNFQGRRNLAVALYYQGEYREAIEAAREVAERFKPGVSDPYWVILKSHLALGEGREALEAIDTYEWIRSSLPGPSLTEERQEAEALIARQASASRPAGEPHILRKTDLRGPGG